MGFPLDDAWIHLTYGRNLAYGLGFGVNPGEPAAASTSVTWSLWLAVLHLIAGRFGLPAVLAATKCSGVALGFAGIVGVDRVLRRWLEPAWARAIGGLVVVSAWPWSWGALSGMEVLLVAALTVWACAHQLAAAAALTDRASWTIPTESEPGYAAPVSRSILHVYDSFTSPVFRSSGDGQAPTAGEQGHRPTASATDHCANARIWTGSGAAVVLWTLAMLTRPETSILAVPAVIMLVAAFPPTWRARAAARAAIVMLAMLLPYALLHCWMVGQPFPSTFTSKMTDRALPLLLTAGRWSDAVRALVTSPCQDLGAVAAFVGTESPLVLGLWLFAPLAWRRIDHATTPGDTGWWLAWAGLPLTAVAVGWLAGPELPTIHHGRYLPHTTILAAVAATGAVGRWWLDRAVAGRPARAGWLVLVTGLLISGGRILELAPLHAAEVANINRMQVTIARWFGREVPPGLTVAVNDLGAMAYFGRQRLLDLEGLITPAANPWRRQERIDGFLTERRPDLLLIFPYWYRELASQPATFSPRICFTVERNVTGGGEEMVLYTMPWSQWLPEGAALPTARPVGKTARPLWWIDLDRLASGVIVWPATVPVPMPLPPVRAPTDPGRQDDG